MQRPLRLLVALAVVVGCTRANADEPHREWMRYFQGGWTYEWQSLGIKGEATYSVAADQRAVVVHGVTHDGATAELIAWHPDTKKMVFTGYGSKRGNYWRAEYGDLSKETISGKVTGMLPDGRAADGAVTIQRLNDDQFEVKYNGTADGQPITDVAKFSRIPDSGGDPPTHYLLVYYMQVPDGGDDLYREVEQAWKKVHEIRRDRGVIRGWAMSRVNRTEGPEADYNYTTVELFDSWQKLEKPFPWAVIQSQLSPTEKEQELFGKTGEAREIVRTEVWTLLDSAIPSRWGDNNFDGTMRLAFMKSHDASEHARLEREVWKKAWAQAAKDGLRWNWHLWGRRFPGGSKHAFDAVAVHLFPVGQPGKRAPDDWWDEAGPKAFPGKSPEEIERLFEPTAKVRTITIQEEWEILEFVDATK